MAILCEVCSAFLGLGRLPSTMAKHSHYNPGSVTHYENTPEDFVLYQNPSDYLEAGNKLGCQPCLLFLSQITDEELKTWKYTLSGEPILRLRCNSLLVGLMRVWDMSKVGGRS